MTPKQQLFLNAYLANGSNATQAAITAKYSKKTAASQGQRLLKNVEIQKALGKRMKRATMSAEDVLNELAKIAQGDYSTYKGDKVKSLDLLGKYHKLFTDKFEHSGPNGGPIEVATRVIKPKSEDL